MSAPRTLSEIVRRHCDPEVREFRGAFRGWMTSGVGTVFGPSSVGKSFVAIDAAIRKVAGWDLGPYHNPEPRPVLYLAAEDRDGIEFRLAATVLDLGLDLDLPIAVAEPPRDYGAPAFAGDVVEMARRLFPDRPPGLIVVDTLGAGIGPGSLNDDSTATPAMGQFHRLSALLDGATILVLHHRSKPSNREGTSTDARERGSGVIRDRADFAISLAADRTGRIVTATNEKMRNGTRGARLVYRLGEIDAGTRTTTPETTLRVISIAGENPRAQEQSSETEQRSQTPLVKGDTLTALRVLDRLQSVASDRCTVAFADWRKAVASALQKRTPETFRSTWKRAHETLATLGLVQIDGDRCTVSNLGNETLCNACNAPTESVASRSAPLKGRTNATPREARAVEEGGTATKRRRARPESDAPKGARRTTSEARS